MFKDPFDPKTLLAQRCGCGGDHAPADHARLSAVPARDDQRFSRVVDAAVLRAVFPVDAQRRLFAFSAPEAVHHSETAAMRSRAFRSSNWLSFCALAVNIDRSKCGW